ncbi:flavodoxin domain-containing protein [Anoxybacillus sp. ST4]|uniref:flavodoxin domain-containing protein n=1 Tax=Anoxybacillus sp. ST4 TaxID=2864181 RepID=UPI001C643E42|nr:flavodoxin domain-containing protein [Anoxybacillus sp. ST4]MBW7649954.1 flavodoxin domain-containing protein [Anoxybacillus sp. ST4]
MNVLICYTSKTGNTKEVALLIEQAFRSYGHAVKTIDVQHTFAIESLIREAHLLLFGSYTWGNGQLPDEMRKLLRFLIKERKLPLPPVALFGTGDQMWTYYCRAVDEMAYHLQKVTSVLGMLKIEQSPRGHQKHLPAIFVQQLLQEVERFVIDESEIVGTVASK